MLKPALSKLIIVLLFSFPIFTHVLAQADDDAETLNKLLTDGSAVVTVDKLLQEATFDNEDDWETSSSDDKSAEINDGVLTLALTGDTQLQALNGNNVTGTVVQVKTTQLSSVEDNAYGVICRADASDNGNGYYFQISGDGFYRIVLVDGEETALVNWAKSKAINTGKDENELTVVCAGTYLAMYVNEVLVAETNDDTFVFGNTGFAVAVFGGIEDVEIQFDDVRIWSATNSTAEEPVAAATLEPAESLVNYDGDSKDAIRELEQLGMIPSGSSLIFSEDYAYFAGQGAWFTPLAPNSPRQNIVIGAELTFEIGNTQEYESCSMLARIKTDSGGTATTYLDIGVDNTRVSYIYDVFSESQDGRYVESGRLLDLSKPHHFLFTLIDDRANLYVDGELELKDILIVERSGSYGVALWGAGPNARCEGRNIWAYSVPNVQPGECVVNSTSNANKRKGPGTNFEVAGQLVPGEDNLVTAQGKGDDGKMWWQLEDETWVREDLVSAIGDCANIPIISPT